MKKLLCLHNYKLKDTFGAYSRDGSYYGFSLIFECEKCNKTKIKTIKIKTKYLKGAK